MRWIVIVVALVCDSLRAAVGEHFAKWLRNHGHDVVDHPLSEDAASTLANCFTIDDLVCARGVFDARSKTDTLVYIGIDRAGKNVTFNVYWFHKGKDAVGERRVCEKCEGSAWQGLIDKMLERLAGDDVLEPKPASPPSRPSRLLPALVFGGGIASIGAGAVFLYYGSLDGPDQKYIYPSSTPVGIALVAVGLGASIGGTIWLIQTGSSQSGPVASATRDGAYLGWAGHF
jgi:hypothetical protein